MKYRIMVGMLFMLLSKRKVSAGYIASRYEISIRSVYRYVDEMIIAGIPINIIRGRYGGITIADTFRLPAGFFSKDEHAAAVRALTAMMSQVSDEALESALEKLQSNIRSENRDISISGSIIVDGGTWGDTKRFSDKMDICEKAVNESLSIYIEYISREGEHSQRVIDPHVLVYKQNVWYVYAFCHTKQSFRTFKIGRIKSARFTGEKFLKQKITRDMIPLNFSYRTEDLIQVSLEIEKESLADVEEWIGVDNIEPYKDKFIADISLPDDNTLVGRILSFGGGIRVLSPADLKERVKMTAARISENA